MKNPILISVVIPLYNKQRSITNTIHSVLSQTILPAEIIVINDGSTDNSLQVVKEINSPLIKIINKNNQGVSKARNVGLKNAMYPWIAFLDGDDIWLPNHLDQLIKLVNVFPDNKFFTTSFSINTHNFEDVKSGKNYLITNYFKTFSEKSYLINSSTAFINKICFEEIGGFDQNLKCGEDIDYWLRLFYKYKLVKSEKITSLYMMNSENRALSRNIPFYNDFASKIDLIGKTGLERKYYKEYLISKIKTYLYKKEFKNLFLLLRKHKLEILK